MAGRPDLHGDGDRLMMTTLELLEPLARRRGDQVVVTTMSVTRPWGRLSDHDLDFASADSAMGHAADLALGIALARPERRVVCLNGDGSMLMTLGTLATVAGSGAENFILVVVDNAGYEITGGQPVAGVSVDYAAMAKGAGIPRTLTVTSAREWDEALDHVLGSSGPTLIHARVALGDEGPISRSAREEARYLRTSLAEWSASLRECLTRGAG
ncbi:MAG: thiamine pyrophosphate-dependent enzyme [Gemmatimonadota bacterium]|nr:thiamine pyrophosphate-dependent enzyme [Gemmatimonadota bacterium]MDH5759752.1 thiamine pyrophosphate-dependent enzyme [Gemmatimonadota bacterium]